MPGEPRCTGWYNPGMRAGPVISLTLLLVLSVLLILLSNPEPSAAQVHLSGQVRDDHGPVSGAVVRFKGTSASVTSDALGGFRLPLGGRTSARVTAWKDGHFIAGSPSDAFPLRLALHRLPAEDN